MRTRKVLAKASVRRRTLAGYIARRGDIAPRRPDLRPDSALPA